MELIYWLLTVICIILSGALLFIKCNSSIWLSSFLAFLAGYLGLILLDAQDFYISPSLYFLLLPIIYLPGPLLLGYVGHISTRRYVGFRDFTPCLLPPLMVLVAPDQVTDVSLFSTASAVDYQTASYIGLFNLLSAVAGLQMLLYVAMSFWLILKLRQDWSSYQSRTMPTNWYKMVLVLAVFLLIASLQVVSAFLHPAGAEVSLGDIAFILWVLFFIGLALQTAYEKVIQGKEDEIILQESESAALLAEAAGPSEEEMAAQNYAAQLRQRIVESSMYLQPELSLSSLAEQLETTPHKLSELINQVFGQTFYEFINDLRIQYAASLLQQEKDKSITEVFYEAGFTTKSTFYSHFKKIYNCTPTEFRSQN